ncbi:proline dehydrogenase [Austwickia chelonae]|uniref:proline dehydrogenase n=1 Tax=Austwickia chelonae TaxID=100225 RepID=UPI000E28812A|nr:proline dehydrogenase [Austwickia chelonae]
MPAAKAVLSASLRRVAREGRLRRFVEAPTVGHEIVNRYVAGESLGSAVDAAAELTFKRRYVCLTSLHSEIDSEERAKYNAKRYRKLLRRLGAAGLTSGGRCEVSFQLAALGLELGTNGAGLALEHARRICREAANVGASVTVETHHPETVDLTLETVADLREDFPGVGVSLQAALRRTESDVREQSGQRVRLWKGPAGSGNDRFRHAAEVDRAFVRNLKVLMAQPGTPVVATQDVRLIDIADALARYLDRPRDQYEYQIRYGVRPETQAIIGDRGDRCRVYVPFGEDWYSYLISRVADDPTNVGDLLKATFAR